MQFFTRFEPHSLARGYAHFRASAWIPADAGFPGADTEDAESAQFYALAGGEGLFEALEDGIHRSLCLRTRQARALDYVMDDVLFDQGDDLAGATWIECTTAYGVDATGFAAILGIVRKWKSQPFAGSGIPTVCLPSQMLGEILKKRDPRLSTIGRLP
jgi:hypothetical protein